MRTFVFKGITIDTENCKQANNIQYSGQKVLANIDLTKPMPIRTQEDRQN